MLCFSLICIIYYLKVPNHVEFLPHTTNFERKIMDDFACDKTKSCRHESWLYLAITYHHYWLPIHASATSTAAAAIWKLNIIFFCSKISLLDIFWPLVICTNSCMFTVHSKNSFHSAMKWLELQPKVKKWWAIMSDEWPKKLPCDLHRRAD